MESKKQTPVLPVRDKRNGLRFFVIMIFGLFCYYLIRDFWHSGAIFSGPEMRPWYYYLIFGIPAFVSLDELYLFWKARKQHIPMMPVSRILIFGVWIVSGLFYLIYAYNYLLL